MVSRRSLVRDDGRGLGAASAEVALTERQGGRLTLPRQRKRRAEIALHSMTMIADAVRLMFFPAMMAFAASSDLLTMTISNRVSLALVGGFFALAAAGGMGIADMLSHLSAAGVVLVAAFGLFVRGWVGGGDAKLAAATALWLGFDQLLPYVAYASLLGGALSVALLQFRLAPLPHWLAGTKWVQRLHAHGAGVPYGVPLAAAALAVYPHTPWMALGL